MKQLCGVVWPCINIRLCPPPIITSPTLHSARKPHYTFLHHAKWYLPVPVVPKLRFRSYGYSGVTPAFAIFGCFWSRMSPDFALVSPDIARYKLQRVGAPEWYKYCLHTEHQHAATKINIRHGFIWTGLEWSFVVVLLPLSFLDLRHNC